MVVRSAGLVLAALAVCTAGACDRPAGHDRALPSDRSPGPRTTAYLPPAPNNAGTGSSTVNTPNAVAGGQLPDWSNPTPPGLPAASGPLNGR
ncbi:hypothetical protein [Reyranella sp.]|uniref:hypothetical protein n=1 Tax=Reyranella sp. TaxID=1929291 RepID=UPI002F91FE29